MIKRSRYYYIIIQCQGLFSCTADLCLEGYIPDDPYPKRWLAHTRVRMHMRMRIPAIFPKMTAAEYQSLVKCADELIQLIQHNIVSVSSKLFAKGLVPQDIHDSVLNVDGTSNRAKAAKLLSCVLDKIKESAGRFQDFIDVLGEDSYFDDVVLKIKEVRGKYPSLYIYIVRGIFIIYKKKSTSYQHEALVILIDTFYTRS